MWHRLAGSLTVALVVGLAGGCTGGQQDAAVPDPTPDSTVPSNDFEVELDGPIERNDVPTLLAIGPRAGSYTTTVEVPAETFELLLNCTGGELTVEIEGVATLPFPCELDELRQPQQYGAEVNLRQAREVTVTVATDPPSVRWRMHIGLLPGPSGVETASPPGPAALESTW